jgi:hypothetical protein
LQLFHWCLNRKIKTDYLLNDPLARDKTKGMSNPKNMPFLMCPTRRTGALGGTPLTRSEAGGHIKKGAWVHVHDAALLALEWLAEKAQAEAGGDREDEAGQGRGGDVLVDAVGDQSEVDQQQEAEGEAHGSGLYCGLALHPENIPRDASAKTLTPDTCFTLDGRAVLRWNALALLPHARRTGGHADPARQHTDAAGNCNGLVERFHAVITWFHVDP